MMSFFDSVDPGPAAAGCAAALALAACAALAARKGRLARTTLVAPWWWTLLAVLAVATTEVILGMDAVEVSAAGRSYYRFVAAAATFCPLMAVLGAKRPQDRGWQFIVASLWLVLSWPAISGLLLRPAGELRVHAAWQWFLLALGAVGLFNGLPTRHAVAAALAGAGQLLLVASWLPAIVAGWLPRLIPDADARALLGLLLCVAGVVAWGLRRPRPALAAPLDRVWLDFRDSFGAVWGLRVFERFNSAAALCRWNVRLRWGGLAPARSGHEPDAAALRAARHSLRQLLRRFVSAAWLAERWDEGNPAALPAQPQSTIASHADAAASNYTEGH